jgi:hypothetical protein
MREFTRLPVVCGHCGANIYVGFSLSSIQNYDPVNDVHADWREPPNKSEVCPRCQSPVDTSSVYPTLPDFPPTFEALKVCYASFTPKWESNRDSFDARIRALPLMV